MNFKNIFYCVGLLAFSGNSFAGKLTPQQRLVSGILDRKNRLVEQALAAGADVNAQCHAVVGEPGYMTSVHMAATSSPEILELVLAQTADVNATDSRGETPLFHAIGYYPRKENVLALLREGADPNIRPHFGLDPESSIARAVRLKHFDLIPALLHFGGSTLVATRAAGVCEEMRDFIKKEAKRQQCIALAVCLVAASRGKAKYPREWIQCVVDQMPDDAVVPFLRKPSS